MLRAPGNWTSDKPAYSASEARGEKPLLVVRNVGVEFGGIAALKNVSFDVPRGDIVGLIGPNGAGKTTLFNCLSRIYRPSRGDILLENRSILQQPQHRIAAMGIGRTFQNVALFSTLSVRDNIRIGGHSITKSDAISDMIRLPRRRRTGDVSTKSYARFANFSSCGKSKIWRSRVYPSARRSGSNSDERWL
jgi:branched-chain amino acid transport system ATP-binding protein